MSLSWPTPVSRFLRAGWEFLFPTACVACGIELATPAQRCANQPGVDCGDPTIERVSLLCGECKGRFTESITPHQCLRCGAPVGPYVNTEHGCLECRSQRFTFQTVHRLGVYDGPLREAVLRGKYLGGEPLLRALAELLWERHGQRMASAGIDLVVPIPQFWLQRISRQHHAPDLLAEAWARCLKTRVGLSTLVKRKWTRKQAKLSRTERIANQQEVFRVSRGSQVKDKVVLIADDVLTTGATANAAAKALKAAGAAHVEVVVLARVLGCS